VKGYQKRHWVNYRIGVYNSAQLLMINKYILFLAFNAFGDSVNVKEITRAARYGHIVGTCHTMRGELFDREQLRKLGKKLSGVGGRHSRECTTRSEPHSSALTKKLLY
jgi:hypothetical protein